MRPIRSLSATAAAIAIAAGAVVSPVALASPVAEPVAPEAETEVVEEVRAADTTDQDSLPTGEEQQ
ncbi:hypothetical protein [Corynebacterium camporealensis]|uniref:Uncharacterized protein n=1 Tax=Corynebacterium camporealensis TaxID=161896 RepID=A0A0F6TA57_9CORY|nr:hypothetical protein [Corynebacterium camporealensis]AKE38214.1 hypothetical protein UL81_01145 [Corynebacterium camporealensis]